MQELKNRLEQEIKHDDYAKENEWPLRTAACKWALFVVRNNTGEALKRGLEISRALTDYTNFLEHGPEV